MNFLKAKKTQLISYALIANMGLDPAETGL